MEEAHKYECFQREKQIVRREDHFNRCLPQIVIDRCEATLPEGLKNRRFLHSDNKFYEFRIF